MTSASHLYRRLICILYIFSRVSSLVKWDKKKFDCSLPLIGYDPIESSFGDEGVVSIFVSLLIFIEKDVTQSLSHANEIQAGIELHEDDEETFSGNVTKRRKKRRTLLRLEQKGQWSKEQRKDETRRSSGRKELWERNSFSQTQLFLFLVLSWYLYPYFSAVLIPSFFLILSQVWVPLKRSERAWERETGRQGIELAVQLPPK